MEEDMDICEKKSTPAARLPVFIIEDGYFGWQENEYILREISLAIPMSKLTMVVGAVGSGKSTLCKVLLGEIPFAKGRVLFSSNRSTIGFCDQRPFLPDASIRDIIVGGGDYDKAWYDKVVEVTALWPDIKLFTNHDQFKIGSDGVKLSGGQRQRLSIARAIYAKPAVFIFDDIFSGLDGQTEDVIFGGLFAADGLLRQLSTTVVLCGNLTKRLSSADHIIALGLDGSITTQGTYDQVMLDPTEDISLTFRGMDSAVTRASSGTASEPTELPATLKTSDDGNKDGRQVGDLSAYKRYLSSVGLTSLLLFLTLSLVAAFCYSFTTVWVKYWSEFNTRHPQDHSRQGFYLGIYALIQILGILCLTAAIAVSSITMVKRSSWLFHLRAIRTLLSAPLDLFYNTSQGVLLSRFAQDLGIVDTELELHFSELIYNIELSMGLAAVVAIASPFLIISYPFLGGILYTVGRFYLRTSRQLRFIDLEQKSPLFYLGNIVREWTQLELGLGAVSRLEGFQNIEKEGHEDINAKEMPDNWPQFGSIEIKNVSACYPRALDGTNDSIVTTDRMALRQITLSDILSFSSGNTFRACLDPYSNASIAECEAVSKVVGIWHIIAERGGLQALMESNNLSQGQKQLFGIARAVLRVRIRNKALSLQNNESGGGILLLDEITSNMDDETDARIQRIIRKEFEGYTIINVCHKQETVQDFDRMIVMDDGAIIGDHSLKALSH
ncbi:hypothetical protein ZTR_09349 [Talaromyces verruculosus]|nr:hypothetical protein ZTR_09349 [Talaromyces verruculosus]